MKFQLNQFANTDGGGVRADISGFVLLQVTKVIIYIFWLSLCHRSKYVRGAFDTQWTHSDIRIFAHTKKEVEKRHISNVNERKSFIKKCHQKSVLALSLKHNSIFHTYWRIFARMTDSQMWNIHHKDKLI